MVYYPGGDSVLKEACAENFTNVPELIERGAKRIELCDNLADLEKVLEFTEVHGTRIV